MSEYTNVEHPFLEKLREIGWKVMDKGACGIIKQDEILVSIFEKNDKKTYLCNFYRHIYILI